MGDLRYDRLRFLSIVVLLSLWFPLVDYVSAHKSPLDLRREVSDVKFFLDNLKLLFSSLFLHFLILPSNEVLRLINLRILHVTRYLLNLF